MNDRVQGAWPAGAALLLLLAGPGQTAALETENEPLELEGIEVQSPPLDGAVVRLNPQDMADGRELADALRDIAGVSGSRMGGHGTDPSIRGLSQNRINVLLDGAFVYGACPNRMDPPTAYASAATYDAITVVRGVATLEYPGGPGGSVLLERSAPTFRPGDGPRLTADLGFRSNSETLDGAFDVAAGNARGFVRAFGSYADADNYEDGDGVEVRSAWQERVGGLLLGWTPDTSQSLVLTAETRQLRDELFAGAGMDSPSSDSDILRLNYQHEALTDSAALKASVYRASVHHVMDNYSLRTPPSPMMRLRVPSDSDTVGGQATLELDQGPNRWRVGVSLQDNERSARRFNDARGVLQSVMWPDVTVRQTGLFAELIHGFGRQRLIAGLRYDRVSASADATGEDPPGMPLSPDQLYGLYYGLSGAGTRRENNIGALLRLERDLDDDFGTVYAGISQTMRTADATERYLGANGATPSMRWVGNPGLEPESHRQAELGWYAGRGPWNAEASVYYNAVGDFILRDRFNQPGNNATIYRNVAAELIGAELSLGVQWGEHWRGTISTAYVRAENTDENRPIAQIPPWEMVASLEYETPQWLAGARVRSAAGQSRVDDDPLDGSGLDAGETPGWAVLDLYARMELGDHWSLNLGIDNVFDRTYAQHLNRANAFDPVQVQVNEPGLSAWLRLGMAFGS